MKRVLDGYHWVLKFAMAALMGLMIIPILLQIISRHTGWIPRYIWTEEAARFCFIWIIMLGSMIAVRDWSHFDVDLLPAPESARQAGVSKLIVHLIVLMLSAVFTWYGWDYARFGFTQSSEMSGINMMALYISFPLAGFTWTVFLLEHIVADVREIVRPDSGASRWEQAK